MLFASTPLLTLNFREEWGGQDKTTSWSSGGVRALGQKQTRSIAGWKGVLSPVSAGSRACSAKQDMLAGGTGPPKLGRVAMVATMAASRGAAGLDAWRDLELGRMGIRGQRTGLSGGALWEVVGVLQSQAQPAGRAGGISGTRSWGLGSLEKATCRL